MFDNNTGFPFLPGPQIDAITAIDRRLAVYLGHDPTPAAAGYRRRIKASDVAIVDRAVGR